MCERGDAICPLLCRMENLFINRFMHMFQSSWSDFADFEKIFVKISNTISGECAFGGSHGAGRLVWDWKVLPHPAPPWLACQAQLPRPPHYPGCHPLHLPLLPLVVAYFVLLPTVPKGSNVSTSSPVVFCFCFCFFYTSHHDRCEVVLTCISLIVKFTEYFFIDLLAIYVFREMSV